jgi:hypothetical protein
MKKIVTLLILFFLSFGINAQTELDYGLFTDRDVYISGETALAKIYLPSNNLSRILRIDMINMNGKSVSSASLEIRNNEANGYLTLPDSLSTGTYLLRAFLKNETANYPIQKELYIGNRFDGLEGKTAIKKLVSTNQVECKLTNHINIKGIDSSIKTNTTADFSIQIDDSLLQQTDGTLFVCISRFFPDFDSSTSRFASSFRANRLVENKGIIFSGHVIDKKTNLPASEATVYLTIPDSIPAFQYFITGEDGHFKFLLEDYYGEVNAVIQCYPKDLSQRLKIIFDEAEGRPASMPDFETKVLSDNFRNELSQNIDAVTLQKIFEQNMLTYLSTPQRKIDSYPYYGIFTTKADPKLFIDLPNFAEISKELLQGVKFRNFNNEPTLQVINAPLRRYFTEQPLVLIDGIPVRDLNLIKDLGTKDIDHIEVCQSERYFGDLRFPGVVAIYSTKPDILNFPESDQMKIMKIQTIQIPAQLAEPFISEPSIPELRQVLYWNPLVKPFNNITLKFKTSNIQGYFKLLIRGKASDGTYFYAEKLFEVK